MPFPILAYLFFLGMVAGIAVALPYGPVGFVIIRRFYLFGMKSGMISAFGNALSDGFYAVVVGFGLHRISHFLLSISKYTEVGAGIVLCYLGVHAIRYKIELGEDEEEKHPVGDISSAFFLNILNPALVFAFVLVFSILAKIMHGTHIGIYGTLAFLIAIPIGTCGFWYLVGKLIRFLRKKNRHAIVQKINYVTGAILLFLGIAILVISVVRWF